MSSRADVRRIALSLPGAIEVSGRFAFAVMAKGKPKEFAWVWMERVDPKKPRVANPSVIAVRVASLERKDREIAARPDAVFTEPHYNGCPAVLLRLELMSLNVLEEMLIEAWRCQASRDLQLTREVAPPRSATRRSRRRG